jgi:hypothetical protein
MRHGFSPVSIALAGLLIVGSGPPSLAQATREAQAPIQVMILGVFHFTNPNADYAKFQGTDVLTPARQQEIQAVVNHLARFGPTKIAVERVPGEADSINADYQRYVAGASC